MCCWLRDCWAVNETAEVGPAYARGRAAGLAVEAVASCPSTRAKERARVVWCGAAFEDSRKKIEYRD